MFTLATVDDPSYCWMYRCLYVGRSQGKYKRIDVGLYRCLVTGMAKVTLVLPDDLLTELRHAVIEKYDAEKGALSKAVADAIELWLKQKEAPAKKR
jgi:hypothetical protein